MAVQFTGPPVSVVTLNWSAAWRLQVCGVVRMPAASETRSVPTLVSWISQVMTLLPGDVILTGTPAGVGPLRDGDDVEVTIEGIGILANTVAG